jgi:hypothetical protein
LWTFRAIVHQTARVCRDDSKMLHRAGHNCQRILNLFCLTLMFLIVA